MDNRWNVMDTAELFMCVIYRKCSELLSRSSRELINFLLPFGADVDYCYHGQLAT